MKLFPISPELTLKGKWAIILIIIILILWMSEYKVVSN